MIVSRNGTSYDTSDGSEQPHAASVRKVEPAERAAVNRWEDDGPGPHAHTSSPPAGPARKPVWSVLSVQNLLATIRRLKRTDDPARVRQEAERAERQRAGAEQGRQRNAAADAQAQRDRHRNDWEHT